MLRRLVLPALFATALSVTTLAGELGTQREFRNWLASCDNVRSCQAVSLKPDADDTAWVLRLQRDGTASAPVQLSILPTDGEPGPGTRLVIAHAGGPIATLAVGRGMAIVDEVLVIQDRAAIQAVLSAARTAESLDLRFDPAIPADKPVQTISLAGISAALLWIDEQQQRVGTTTALVRPGSRPASAVPAPPALPPAPPERSQPAGSSKPVSDAARQAMEQHSQSYCERDARSPDTEGATAIPLGGTLLLASVRCFSGAYNFSRAFFLLEDGPQPVIRPALFPRPHRDATPDDPQSPDNVLTNGEPDEVSAAVSYYAKGRGLGDCGDLGTWQWDGRAFQPIVYRRMPVCRGIPAYHWPLLYRTR